MPHCKEICIDKLKYQLKSEGDPGTSVSLIMINREHRIFPPTFFLWLYLLFHPYTLHSTPASPSSSCRCSKPCTISSISFTNTSLSHRLSTPQNKMLHILVMLYIVILREVVLVFAIAIANCIAKYKDQHVHP